MQHTKHLWRAGILLVIILTAVIVGRHFLVPPTFGEMGYFRGDALYEFMDKVPEHGGADACADCHDEEAEAHGDGAHAGVQCEVCHATLASHVADDEKIAAMAVDRSWNLCSHCHRQLAARPPSQPQVDIAEHLELAPGDPVPSGACLDCHDPHGP